MTLFILYKLLEGQQSYDFSSVNVDVIRLFLPIIKLRFCSDLLEFPDDLQSSIIAER